MAWFDLACAYEIERETVSTLLAGALATRGAEQQFARRVGMTSVHLSYIRSGKRMPTVRAAKRITAALHWTNEQRESFVHHVARVWHLKASLHQTGAWHSRPGQPAQYIVDLIRAEHHTAMFTREPATAHRLYRRARNMAELVLDATHPAQDPLNFVELSLVAHDALCVLNRNDEALWHAKRLRAVAAQLERSKYKDKARIDFLQVNALRSEAVALYNLGLARPMQRLNQEIETLAPLKRQETTWRPILNRDKMQALAEIPRFSIHEVEALAHDALSRCTVSADFYAPVLAVLVSQELAHAYMQHANFDKAYHVLCKEMDKLQTIPQLGTLPQVLFYKTFAECYWRQDSRGADWRYLAGAAMRIATEAGLEHQINLIKQAFGGEV